MTNTDAMYHYAHEIAKREARIRELEAEVERLKADVQQQMGAACQLAINERALSSQNAALREAGKFVIENNQIHYG